MPKQTKCIADKATAPSARAQAVRDAFNKAKRDAPDPSVRAQAVRDTLNNPITHGIPGVRDGINNPQIPENKKGNQKGQLQQR